METTSTHEQLVHKNAFLGQDFLVDDGRYSQEANELEEAVWLKAGFGTSEPNRKYDSQSRLIVTLDQESGDVIGGTRMFGSGEYTLPFLAEMKFEDDLLKDELIECAENGLIEEYGTLYVDKTRASRVASFTNMTRIAYRDAVVRGIKYWGIIMEPERVESMNERFQFTFRQLGEAIDYQGGDCAAHIMDLDEVYENMKEKDPALHYWFTEEPL